MQIVQAVLEDAEALLSLQRLAYQSEAALYQDWRIPPLTQTLSDLRKEFSQATILKAMLDSTIIGSVRATEQDGVVSIGRLIVHPAQQRRGIGRRLMTAIESRYPQARLYELFTGSLSQGNIHFYQELGYTISHTNVLSDKVTLVFLRKIRPVYRNLPAPGRNQ